jgi:hypothetical protein
LQKLNSRSNLVAKIIDVFVSILLAGLLLYLALVSPSEQLPKEALILLLTFYLGLLFTCAYAFTDRLILFRVLAFVATYVSYPRRKEMAIVYAVIFFAAAAYFFIASFNGH